MNEQSLYDYLRSLLPEFQFINAYTDDVPVPLSDYGIINIIDVEDRGWSQRRQASYNETTGVIKNAYDVQRIYKIQFDFYGVNAFQTATEYKQILQINLANTFGLADLKKISSIRNLTFLQENKTYLKRYSFDAEVFVVDTVEQNSPVIETATVKIINRGNNFN